MQYDTEDPSIMAHKAITTLVWSLSVISLIVGTYLVTKQRTHIVVRTRGYLSIIITSVIMAVWTAIQLTRIWEWLVSCFAIFLLVQVVIAVVSCVIFYRTYEILHKLAMQQKAQHLMMIIAKTKHGDDVEEAVAAGAEEMEETWCLRHIDLLRGRNRSIYTVLQFILIVAAFFANPSSYQFGADPSCSVNSSLYTGIFLVVLYLFVASSFRFLDVQDSFHMIEEISYCAVGIVISFILLAIIAAIDAGTDLSGQTVRDLQVDVAIIQQLTVVISIVLMPALWAHEKEDEGSSKRLKPDLVIVLAHKESLELFKAHLIKEWSVENLLFYQDVTTLQIQRRERGAERTLIKIKDLYEKYISSDAPFEVNLSGPVSQPIHKFFKKEMVAKALEIYRSSQGSRRHKSESADFLGIVKKMALTAAKGSDEKEQQHHSSMQLVSLADECLQHFDLAKKEIFRLLNNDSYKRFVADEATQRHFREYKTMLFPEKKTRINKAQSSLQRSRHDVTKTEGKHAVEVEISSIKAHRLERH
mmetsp:Transcript_21238/g.34883  ORF Transcript_21238/g.34883 Transcript_21238/m.34883 type:complete len:529 (-) Transcript_21238:219-1805(-)